MKVEIKTTKQIKEMIEEEKEQLRKDLCIDMDKIRERMFLIEEEIRVKDKKIKLLTEK